MYSHKQQIYLFRLIQSSPLCVLFLRAPMFCSVRFYQRRLPVGVSVTVQLVSSLTRLELTKKENMLLFVCSEAVESILVKLETSRTVILPPMVRVLWVIAGWKSWSSDYGRRLWVWFPAPDTGWMLICCKNCVYLKKTKINEREAAEHGPFLKGCLQVCWLSTIKLLSYLTWQLFGNNDGCN